MANKKLIASNSDGDKCVTLHRNDNGAYDIEIAGQVVEFALDFRQGFQSFGIQIMWACMRSGKISLKEEQNEQR